MAITQSVTSNARLKTWIGEITAMLKPDSVRWCDGTGEEYQEMLQIMVDGGTAM